MSNMISKIASIDFNDSMEWKIGYTFWTLISERGLGPPKDWSDFGLSYKVLAKVNIQIHLIENEIFQGKWIYSYTNDSYY